MLRSFARSCGFKRFRVGAVQGSFLSGAAGDGSSSAYVDLFQVKELES